MLHSRDHDRRRRTASSSDDDDDDDGGNVIEDLAAQKTSDMALARLAEHVFRRRRPALARTAPDDGTESSSSCEEIVNDVMDDDEAVADLSPEPKAVADLSPEPKADAVLSPEPKELDDRLVNKISTDQARVDADHAADGEPSEPKIESSEATLVAADEEAAEPEELYDHIVNEISQDQVPVDAGRRPDAAEGEPAEPTFASSEATHVADIAALDDHCVVNEISTDEVPVDRLDGADAEPSEPLITASEATIVVDDEVAAETVADLSPEQPELVSEAGAVDAPVDDDEVVKEEGKSPFLPNTETSTDQVDDDEGPDGELESLPLPDAETSTDQVDDDEGPDGELESLPLPDASEPQGEVISEVVEGAENSNNVSGDETVTTPAAPTESLVVDDDPDAEPKKARRAFVEPPIPEGNKYRFYMHDVRGGDDDTDGTEAAAAETVRPARRSRADREWTHDLFQRLLPEPRYPRRGPNNQGGPPRQRWVPKGSGDDGHQRPLPASVKASVQEWTQPGSEWKPDGYEAYAHDMKAVSAAKECAAKETATTTTETATASTETATTTGTETAMTTSTETTTTTSSSESGGEIEPIESELNSSWSVPEPVAVLTGREC